MSHSTILQQQGRHPVTASSTVYALYGVRIHPGSSRELLEEDPGHCLNNGSVGFVNHGPMGFLAIWCSHVEYVFHSGEAPNASKFERDRWNDDLRAVCDRLGLEITEGPGWFTIPSEG